MLELDAPGRSRARKIVSADGTIFAETRDDGMRVYPQEWLAGQTIGYVSKVTADDLQTLDARRATGPATRRSQRARACGAEDLLRGPPGFTLTAVDRGRIR